MNGAKNNPMEKLAAFIVDKRNLFFLLYTFAIIFCLFSTGWVKVENDITTYLPDSTETKLGLTLMNDEFVTYGSASVMVSNVSLKRAESLKEKYRKSPALRRLPLIPPRNISKIPPLFSALPSTV